VASREELLADLVFESIAWFELADEKTVHPDDAVQMLESYAAALERLAPADRAWLRERFLARAAGTPRLEQLAEAMFDE
jgi:hypothetical protein